MLLTYSKVVNHLRTKEKTSVARFSLWVRS